MVSSTLLYGAGTWTRKEQQTKRLESAQYRLASYMLGAKPMDHVRMTTAWGARHVTFESAPSQTQPSIGCQSHQLQWIKATLGRDAQSDGLWEETERAPSSEMVWHTEGCTGFCRPAYLPGMALEYRSYWWQLEEADQRPCQQASDEVQEFEWQHQCQWLIN